MFGIWRSLRIINYYGQSIKFGVTLGEQVSSLIAIPARIKSSRFPNKVLADMLGHPMLWHVYQSVIKVRGLNGVWILTDSQEVMELAISWGAQAMMTSDECPSGTDRIASRIDDLEADIIVNVQADEPLIEPNIIEELIIGLDDDSADIATPIYPIKSPDELFNPNVVKVVRSSDGSIVYFSRSPVPHVRDAESKDWMTKASFWGHAGVYAYRREVLKAFPYLPDSPLEQAEKLEQLRFLEAGKRFLAIEIDDRPLAVDVPEDLHIVIQAMQDRKSTELI